MSFCIRAPLIFGVFVLSENVWATSTFGSELQNCLDKIDVKSRVCPKEGPCLFGEQANACLGTFNFVKGDCVTTRLNTICKSKAVATHFPQTRACTLIVFTPFDAPASIEFGDDMKAKTSCEIEGLTIGPKAVLHVENAERQKNGSWKFPSPTIGYEFESFVPKKALVAETVARADLPPWKAQDECENQIFEDKSGSAQRKKLEQKFGVEKVRDQLRARHYYGRTPTKIGPIVTEFSNKEKIEICSVEIPKGTSLRMSLDANSCQAATDGALTVTIPAALYPALTEEAAAAGVSRVTCAPVAQKKSAFDVLFRASRDGSPDIPRLDWTDCDCEVRPPSYH